MSKNKHPMQPIYLDKNGTARFKENKIVSLLLETSSLDLNNLCIMLHKGILTLDDWIQFMQLIGYSVYGYAELSEMPDKVVLKTEKKAECLVKKNEK